MRKTATQPRAYGSTRLRATSVTFLFETCRIARFTQIYSLQSQMVQRNFPKPKKIELLRLFCLPVCRVRYVRQRRYRSNAFFTNESRPFSCRKHPRRFAFSNQNRNLRLSKIPWQRLPCAEGSTTAVSEQRHFYKRVLAFFLSQETKTFCIFKPKVASCVRAKYCGNVCRVRNVRQKRYRSYSFLQQKRLPHLGKPKIVLELD